MGEITYREYEYECQARKHNFYLIVICNEHTNSLGGGRWLLMAANSVRIPSRLPTANVSTFRRVAIMPIKLCRGFVFFLQVFAFRYSHHHRCASCAVIWIASVFRVNGSVRFVRTDDSAPSPRVCVCAFSTNGWRSRTQSFLHDCHVTARFNFSTFLVIRNYTWIWLHH